MKSKLYVKNLSFNTEVFDLKRLFSEFGEILSIDIPKNRSTGRSNGFALVEMKNQRGAENVIDNLNETIFKKSKIKITIAED